MVRDDLVGSAALVSEISEATGYTAGTIRAATHLYRLEEHGDRQNRLAHPPDAYGEEWVWVYRGAMAGLRALIARRRVRVVCYAVL